jgi:hypothetical protein
VIDAHGIVNLRWTIEADTNMDLMTAQHLHPFRVKQCRVRLHTEAAEAVPEHHAGARRELPKPLGSHQGRLAAMEAEAHPVRGLDITVLPDSTEQLVVDRIAHGLRTTFEARIRVLVHVAVAAIEIAAFRDLEYQARNPASHHYTP